MIKFFTNFLPYYFLKVFKPLSYLLFKLPYLAGVVMVAIIFYGLEGLINYAEIIVDFMQPLWIYVAMLLFWFLNIKAIYVLWNHSDNQSSSVGEYNILPDRYDNIVRKVEKFIPQNAEDFKEDFIRGYKYLKDAGDIKTVISLHFYSYVIIDTFLSDYFQSGGVGVVISAEIIEIKTKFGENLSELKQYNDSIGRNNDNLPIDEHMIRKLIDNINENLNSLFSYINP